VEFGAPALHIPKPNPERERLGLPDKTPAEKALDAPKWQ
jgi:hypothetical protein